MSSASTLSMHPKKICHPKLVVNQDATSSDANSRPPIGALKATATPMPEPASSALCDKDPNTATHGLALTAAGGTPEPAVTKSRLSFGFLKRVNKSVLSPRVVEWP